MQAYIVGGLDLASLYAVDTLYMYDPILDTYTNLSIMPEPRCGPQTLNPDP